MSVFLNSCLEVEKLSDIFLVHLAGLMLKMFSGLLSVGNIGIE
jgi:hypothetical protein